MQNHLILNTSGQRDHASLLARMEDAPKPLKKESKILSALHGFAPRDTNGTHHHETLKTLFVRTLARLRANLRKFLLDLDGRNTTLGMIVNSSTTKIISMISNYEEE